ncbi:hypothetical protein LY76DRAFT_319403 [Colletotrichum caudatum]|nr:hypothetical protein LY76DRAFT_319403 [Colletotrichum caudatum]
MVSARKESDSSKQGCRRRTAPHLPSSGQGENCRHLHGKRKAQAKVSLTNSIPTVGISRSSPFASDRVPTNNAGLLEIHLHSPRFLSFGFCHDNHLILVLTQLQVLQVSSKPLSQPSMTSTSAKGLRIPRFFSLPICILPALAALEPVRCYCSHH